MGFFFSSVTGSSTLNVNVTCIRTVGIGMNYFVSKYLQ